MSEARKTETIETELKNKEIPTQEQVTKEDTKEVQEVEIELRIKKRDQLFDEIKNALVTQDRILKKFFIYSDEHCEFDFEEIGLSFQEEEDHLRRTNKLKDKILDNVERLLEIKLANRKIDTLHNMIICDSTFDEENFRIIIEVYEDSFDLEVV